MAIFGLTRLMYGGELFIEEDILKADPNSILNNLDKFTTLYDSKDVDYFISSGDPKMFRYILAYLNCLRHGFKTARILPSSVEELSRLSVECALLNLNGLKKMVEDMLSSYQSSEDNNYEKVYLKKVLEKSEHPSPLFHMNGTN
uniref:BTB_2 domain-containing protein n=1 Tax=Strongyloides papillosus TaxID=174720 RepID=A0A0N5CAW5_STREA